MKIYRIIPVALSFGIRPTTALAQASEGFTYDRVVRILFSFVDFLLTAALLIAVIYIIWYAIQIMTAGSDAAKVNKAKRSLWVTIIGLFVVLGVQVIMATVQDVVLQLRGR